MHIYTLALNLTHVKEASVLKECKTHDANCYLFMFSHKDIQTHPSTSGICTSMRGLIESSLVNMRVSGEH